MVSRSPRLVEAVASESPCKQVPQIAIAALALLSAGTWPAWNAVAATEEPAPAAAEQRPGASISQDFRLTLEARRALAADEQLRLLNVGVQVRKGVATLYGPIPSAQLADHARELLRALKGLREVRSELAVLPPEDVPLPAEDARAAKTAPPDVAALAGKYPRTSGTLQERHQEPIAEPVSGAPDRAVELLPPIPVIPGATPDAKRVPSGPVQLDEPLHELRAAIEQRQQAEPRFRTIAFEVRERVVYLRGSGPDVVAFAQAVSLLPGVERVALVGSSAR